MQLILGYSAWYVVLCFALGLGYALLVYYRSTSLSDASSQLRWLLAGIRTIFVALIAFFLLNPLLQTFAKITERPSVYLVVDNSSSILIGRDSAWYRERLPQVIDSLSDLLSENYEVKRFVAGADVQRTDTLRFSAQMTNLAEVFPAVEALHNSRTAGCIVLLSDGLYNTGLNPEYESAAADLPLITVGLGDTAIKRDVNVKKVMHNRVAYLGNTFPVEVLVAFDRVPGEKVEVTVSREGERLQSIEIPVAGDAFVRKVSFQLEAGRSGLNRFEVSATRVTGEVTYANNRREFYVEVMERKEKILILSAAPHPDVAAIRFALESTQGYEVVCQELSDFSGKWKDYNAVIFHQLPSVSNNTITAAWKQSGIPALFILPPSVNSGAFNGLLTGVKLNTTQMQSSDAAAWLNPQFTLFTLQDPDKQGIPKFPPLTAPLGAVELSQAVEVLAWQQIGPVSTKNPLIAFHTGSDQKTGFIFGEGLWRWRLADYRVNGNHDIFNRLISRSVQYVAIKENFRRFRVSGQESYAEGDRVLFGAEYYNASFEADNQPEVAIRITHQDGREFNFQFNRTGKAYSLDAGTLPSGRYTYKAQVSGMGDISPSKGEFSVEPIQLETVNTTADHGLLRRMASRRGGRSINLQNLAQLPEILSGITTLKPITLADKLLDDLISKTWIFFLILGLFSFEWFVRKRQGSY